MHLKGICKSFLVKPKKLSWYIMTLKYVPCNKAQYIPIWSPPCLPLYAQCCQN